MAPPPISCHRVVRWFPEEDSGVMDVHPTPMEGPFGIHFEPMVLERLSMVQAEVHSYAIVEEVAVTGDAIRMTKKKERPAGRKTRMPGRRIPLTNCSRVAKQALIGGKLFTWLMSDLKL